MAGKRMDNDINNDLKRTEKELAGFLCGFIPVPWTDMIYYAESDGAVWSYFYAFREEKTGIIVTIDSFYRRYESYNYVKREARHILFEFAKKLYRYAGMSAGVSWKEMVCTVKKSGEYRFDYVFPAPDAHGYMTKHELLEKYMDSEYYFVTGKYPSAEHIPFPGSSEKKKDSVIDGTEFDVLPASDK
jgi:hypothetical protein